MDNQVFWTIISGVTVFLIGELLMKVLIEPMQEMRKLIGEIAHSLGYYANQIYGPPGDERTKAKQT